jgi:hypothetical protein
MIDGDAKPAKPDADRLERSIYWIVFGVSAGCLLLGVLLYIGYGSLPDHGATARRFFFQVAYLFATELGIAGLVALVIIITIERFTRSKHQLAADRLIDRIKRNLFDAIFKRHIPAEVFEEVERCLLTNNIVRRNYSVNYSIRSIPDEEVNKGAISKADADSHLFCTVSCRYELHNITDGITKAPIELHLELPIDEALRKFVEIEELRIDNSITQINKKPDTASHRGSMNEVTISANGSVKVSIRGKTVKRKTDMEVWASRLPSDGMKLQVVAPPTIRVNAVANHSSSLTYEVLDNGQTHVWELERGIFPFQSIIFWWNAK